MSLFGWKTEYAVGSAQIDLQHKQVFRMAGELHDAMVNGQDFEAIQVLLDRLVAYTQHHFTFEDRMMRESGYPGYDQHSQSHQKLAKRVEEFQDRVKSRKVAVPMELTRFLRDWLNHHIRKDDLQFSIYMRTIAAVKAS